jgi:hypothetical protein
MLHYLKEDIFKVRKWRILVRDIFRIKIIMLEDLEMGYFMVRGY